MGLARTGYSDANQGSTRVKYMVNEDGQIAQSDETIASTAYYRISSANPLNSLQDNQKLLNFFISELAGGTTDSSTNTASVTWEV